MASIWVDADACPNVIKEILFRAAERTGVAVTLVANQPLQIPRIPSLRAVQVSSGFDVADGEIVKRVAAGDLVITADIPLAAEVIAKGGEALNPRGERYSPDTIRGVLAMRDFMDTMRSSGNVGGGPPPLTQADRNAFVQLMRHLKEVDAQHTVIMVQVENESGTYGSVRDYSPAAQKLFATAVPPTLLRSLQKKPGTWQQVFGHDADEFFHGVRGSLQRGTLVA